MANNTPAELRNLTIYGLNVRGCRPSGTFRDVIDQLDRLCDMGIKMIWLLPVHPVGAIQRKGSLGSPYSIRSYDEISSEYGGEQGFRELIKEAHKRNIGIMVDIVLNHCAIDNMLTSTNLEWFVREPTGELYIAREGWTDVVGFDFRKSIKERDDYFIQYLCKWASMGVDGFRCDFASAIPLSFWRRAKDEVSHINGKIVWLAESIHATGVSARRSQYLPVASDSELFEVFDITYNYDIWPIWQSCIDGLLPIDRYCEALRWQDAIYPGTYVKLRCVENHDHARILSILDEHRALAWTAFEMFNKGAFLMNAGQEYGETRMFSLFEPDRFDNVQPRFSGFFAKLLALKLEHGVTAGQFVIVDCKETIQSAWECFSSSLYGVFNVSGVSGETEVKLPDGEYVNVLSENMVSVRGGKINAPLTAVVLRYEGGIRMEPFYALGLDYRGHT